MAAAVHRPTPHRAWRAVLAVGLALLAARWGLSATDPVDVVVLPPIGEVRPDVLADGTPVFVHHRGAGDVVVLEALVPETVAGSVIGEMAAWCAWDERFVTGHHGRSFRDDGRRYVGIIRGRLPGDTPAQDMVVRRGVPAEGTTRAGAPARVGAPQPPTSAAPVRPTLTTERSHGPPAVCRVRSHPSLADAPLDPPPVGDPPIDHAAVATPVQSVPGHSDGWRIVHGVVEVEPSGAAWWCADAQVTHPDRCPDGAEWLSLGLGAADTGGGSARLTGPLALRVEGGAVVQLAVMFSTSWVGSSLGGGFTYRARMTGLSAPRSAIDLRPPPLHQSCLVAAPPRPGEVDGRSQFIDADTRVEVDGWDVPMPGTTGPGAVVHGPATVVEVVVDAVTCRALEVRTAP